MGKHGFEYSADELELKRLAEIAYPGLEIHVAVERCTGRWRHDSTVMHDDTGDGTAAERGHYESLVSVGKHPRAKAALLAAMRVLAGEP